MILSSGWLSPLSGGLSLTSLVCLVSLVCLICLVCKVCQDCLGDLVYSGGVVCLVWSVWWVMSRPSRLSAACDLSVRATESGVWARSVQSSWLACLVCLVYLLCLVHLLSL